MLGCMYTGYRSKPALNLIGEPVRHDEMEQINEFTAQGLKRKVISQSASPPLTGGDQGEGDQCDHHNQ